MPWLVLYLKFTLTVSATSQIIKRLTAGSAYPVPLNFVELQVNLRPVPNRSKSVFSFSNKPIFCTRLCQLGSLEEGVRQSHALNSNKEQPFRCVYGFLCCTSTGSLNFSVHDSKTHMMNLVWYFRIHFIITIHHILWVFSLWSFGRDWIMHSSPLGRERCKYRKYSVLMNGQVWYGGNCSTYIILLIIISLSVMKVLCLAAKK